MDVVILLQGIGSSLCTLLFMTCEGLEFDVKLVARISKQ